MDRGLLGGEGSAVGKKEVENGLLWDGSWEFVQLVSAEGAEVFVALEFGGALGAGDIEFEGLLGAASAVCVYLDVGHVDFAFSCLFWVQLLLSEDSGGGEGRDAQPRSLRDA